MAKPLIILDHGIVYSKTVRTKNDAGKLLIMNQPIFRGDAKKYVDALVKKHGHQGAVDLVNGILTPDKWWEQCKALLAKRSK